MTTAQSVRWADPPNRMTSPDPPWFPFPATVTPRGVEIGWL